MRHLPPQYGDLMTQHQQLGVLRALVADAKRHECEQPAEQEVDRSKRHHSMIPGRGDQPASGLFTHEIEFSSGTRLARFHPRFGAVALASRQVGLLRAAEVFDGTGSVGKFNELRVTGQ